jgi:hypothetical protein
VNRFADVEEIEYDPLRDPHLKHHFKKQQYRSLVIRQGLATEDGKVVRSGKQVWST